MAVPNVWSLNMSSDHDRGPNSEIEWLDLSYTNDTSTSPSTFLLKDRRVPVHLDDIVNGGKYQSIVKLFYRYAGQNPAENNGTWAIGTGWLIRPDLLVAAGHCVYDTTSQFGRISEINVYLGYHGKNALDSGGVQFRRGSKVATSLSWLASKDNKMNDLAVVKLEKPFFGVTPFKFMSTPMTGTAEIGVVGYPGDMVTNGEQGALMHELFMTVSFDRSKSDLHMLEYPITTFAGQCGSPVLAVTADGLVPIAIHTYWSLSNSSGTAIGDPELFANRLEDYISLIDGEATSVSFHIHPGTAHAPVAPIGQRVESSLYEDDEERFMDVLKLIAGITHRPRYSILGSAPITSMGPVGAILAPLASVAFNAADKAIKPSRQPGSDTCSVGGLSDSGAAKRAILGEAALSAVLRLERDTLQETDIFGDMRMYFRKNSKLAKMVSPIISKTLLEPALRISLDISREQEEKLQIFQDGRMPRRSVSLRRPLSGEISDNFGGREQARDFVRGLVEEPTLVLPGAEGFFDSIFEVITTGISTVPSFGHDIALIVEATDGASSERAEDAEPDIAAKSFHILGQRAAMGEAALQTLMKQDISFLSRRDMEGWDGEPVSIFDVMKEVIQTVGPKVLKAVPIVVNAVIPVAEGLASRRSRS
ncbi:trypsin-like serine protease [Ascobolus immersus RN42]|uniref:Trypsin-like serine protease n=1 Tax=Ascobolus immersus RN42 TaxID=1160509 RepID=A0A3N4HSX5_ASCIM|nr:trypsin-like serine protease [Ascobolus immersus RN42]